MRTAVHQLCDNALFVNNARYSSPQVSERWPDFILQLWRKIGYKINLGEEGLGLRLRFAREYQFKYTFIKVC